MNDKMPSLPAYPQGPESELPPPRKEWGTALWVPFFVLLTGVAAAFFYGFFLPGLWVFAFSPGSSAVILVGLGICAFAIFILFLYVWQRSERHDR